MSDFTAKINRYCRDQHFPIEHERLLIAVSGGPDSLALLHFFQHSPWPEKVEVAHVHHGLRDSADEDLAFVQAYCHAHQIPFHSLRADVKKHMAETGGGTQAAARHVRYAFFKDIMKKRNLTVLLLGHHADDQIETVLFRLTRGTTLKGVAGIPPSRPFGSGVMIRPFLAVTKSEIEQYCEQHHLTPKIDPTNATDSYARNRIRNHLLPLLKKENPSVHDAFRRFTEEVSEDEAFLLKQATEAFDQVVTRQNEEVLVLHLTAFTDLAPPLQRRVIHLILNYLYAKVPTALSSAHVRAVLQLIEQPHPSGQIHLPEKLTVTRSYADVTFQFSSHRELEEGGYEMVIRPGERVELPDGTIECLEGAVHPAISVRDVYHIDEPVHWPLTVRTRKTGDRIQLPDGNGSKKITRVFIDCKVPLPLRDVWPIVTDSQGTILWVPALRKRTLSKENGEPAAYTLIYY
ncbi:tRNA lysidine(34) synthetase TilS [Jeotgalibacillus aurantiacus]|uniref:tRNA lysidine(34) synthetase TilS n=1 Tax=Jeotgalibacillus aurantiacus TaxID=2763266 RepID=UPI001D0B6F89|nr:tRNA lysidine(34) synthetase TilS [Jeotgalibacillus aurantiacus]